MKFENLQVAMQAIAAVSDLSTLYINIKSLKTKINGKTFDQVLKDEMTIEDILTECFVRREVMWQRAGYENLAWCMASLKEVQQKCDEYSSRFRRTNDDKHHFYAQLMRLWGDHCIEAHKELDRNKNLPHYDLHKPLRKLRRDVYKIVITLGQLLPDANLTKQQTFSKLDMGSNNTKLRVGQILPDWTIG